MTPTNPSAPQAAETRRDWEILQEDIGISKTERLRIAGGWLVRTIIIVDGDPHAVAMVFIPSALSGS